MNNSASCTGSLVTHGVLPGMTISRAVLSYQPNLIRLRPASVVFHRTGADRGPGEPRGLVNALREKLRTAGAPLRTRARRCGARSSSRTSRTATASRRVPAPPPRRRRSSSASLFGDGPDLVAARSLRRPAVAARRSASGSSFVDVGPVHKTRAPRSAARTPRRRGTTPTIDDYYAKYSRSTASGLDHDNATRRTFDEAAGHAEALFAAHDMSPARISSLPFPRYTLKWFC